MTGYLIAPIGIGFVGSLLGALAGPYGMNGMLDYYEGIVGIPIIERSIPLEIYLSIIGLTMIIVFISGVFPAWKATRIDPLEVLGGNSEIRVGSDRLRSLTSWLPSLLGLSIRSSLRKPVRLSMTFLAVGVSLMLAGSIQMMTVSLQDTIVGGLRDGQSWDAQVYIQSDGESSVIDWAEENGASYEIIIETSIGTITDSSGMQRSITLVGLNSYSESESMRNVELIDGEIPIPDSSVPQVIMDEGSLEMLSLIHI